MAMRTRAGGSAATQYENFQPKSERKEEEGATVLLVHLPDFLKEQLKITYVHSSRFVRVTGERPLAYNKWSRFNQTFPVPQNCEVNKIQGKFQNGILYITMPKATITQPVPKEESKGTEEASQPPKDASTEKPMTSQVSPKPTMEPKSQKDAGFASPKQTDDKKAEATSPQEALKDQKYQKDQAEIPPKAASTTDHDQISSAAKTADLKPIIEKNESAAPEVSKKPAEQEEIIKKRKESLAITESQEIIKKRKESLLSTESEESSKKRKESMSASELASLKTLDKDKEKSFKFTTDKEKAKQDFNVAGKIKKVKNVAATAAKKTMNGIDTMELSEERQSMVNMGVAALVIIALGAYMFYSYRSSGTGTPKD